MERAGETTTETMEPQAPRPIVENTEHTIEQRQAEEAERGIEPVARCECDNARCQGHYRRAFCTGPATKGIVNDFRPDTDPVRNLCEVCFGHMMDAGGWREHDLRDDAAETQSMSDTDEDDETDEMRQVRGMREARRSARMAQAERTARTEGAPEANPASDAQRTPETLRTEQAPKRDTEVPAINDDSLTSKIPVLPTPSEMEDNERQDKERQAQSEQEDAAQDNERKAQLETQQREERQRGQDAERRARDQAQTPQPTQTPPPPQNPRRPGSAR